MKKGKAFQLIIFLVSTLFLIQLAFASQENSSISANSSSYYVEMFGNGLVTGTPESASYTTTTLSDTKGTTRNGLSASYTVNIGFFNDTSPHSTVSITSYSISPASAVVGSSISLYISALNAQYVWAKIVAPNAQEQTTALVNNQFIVYSPPSIVGTYTVTFYANSSTGAITSVIDHFALTAVTTPPATTAPSTGGGGTTVIEKCTYLWDCTPWSVCADGKQTRVCKNTGTCTGNESKPIEEMQCSMALFDISLRLKNIGLTENKTLKFGIDLMEKIGIEKIDVYIKYSIVNRGMKFSVK